MDIAIRRVKVFVLANQTHKQTDRQQGSSIGQQSLLVLGIFLKVFELEPVNSVADTHSTH